jgi:hypothetical protein
VWREYSWKINCQSARARTVCLNGLLQRSDGSMNRCAVSWWVEIESQDYECGTPHGQLIKSSGGARVTGRLEPLGASGGGVSMQNPPATVSLPFRNRFIKMHLGWADHQVPRAVRAAKSKDGLDKAAPQWMTPRAYWSHWGVNCRCMQERSRCQAARQEPMTPYVRLIEGLSSF